MSSRVLGFAVLVGLVASTGAFAAITPALDEPHGIGGPQAASFQEDVRLLAAAIEARVAHDKKLTFAALAQQYPYEVLVASLGHLLSRGSVLGRHRAARLLGQAPGAIPVLILLEEVRRPNSLRTAQGIVRALADRGAKSPAHPISEGAFIKTLESIAETPPADVVSYLLPLLNSYPEWRVLTIRTLSRLDAKEAIAPIQSLLGSSDEIDAEALGTLMEMGVRYDEFREKLTRALPRAVDLGEKGVGVFQSILYHLANVCLKKKDELAMRSMFYIVPHANEPFRTYTMATLHRIAVAQPQAFVLALGRIPPADVDEFIPDLVAYVYQKDLDHDFITVMQAAFKDLDLGFAQHDIAQRILRALRDRIP